MDQNVRSNRDSRTATWLKASESAVVDVFDVEKGDFHNSETDAVLVDALRNCLEDDVKLIEIDTDIDDRSGVQTVADRSLWWVAALQLQAESLCFPASDSATMSQSTARRVREALGTTSSVGDSSSGTETISRSELTEAVKQGVREGLEETEAQSRTDTKQSQTNKKSRSKRKFLAVVLGAVTLEFLRRRRRSKKEKVAVTDQY